MKRCIARTKNLERCKNHVEHGSLFFCRRHRWWWIITFLSALAFISSILAANVTVTDRPFFPTQTPTPTQTLTVTSSPTNTLTPTPKPLSESLYYMIVYDSSLKMNESFHGQEKWQVARNMLVEIINGLNPRAQYSFVA